MVALQPQPVEDGDPIFEGNQIEGAVALFLEGLFDLGPRPPFCSEGAVGVDGEGVGGEHIGRQQAGGDQQQGLHGWHSLLLVNNEVPAGEGAKNERHASNSSASIIWIRYTGIISAVNRTPFEKRTALY